MKRVSFALAAGLVAMSFAIPQSFAATTTSYHAAPVVTQTKPHHYYRSGRFHNTRPLLSGSVEGRYEPEARGRFPGTNFVEMTPHEMAAPGLENPYHGGR